MKKILFLALFTITTFATAQDLNNDIKNALKTDNITELIKHINLENINNCYKVEDSEYTLLALSIKLNAKSCFTSLIEQKADLEKMCSDKTPLMYAAKYDRLDMAKSLVNAGAKLKATNNKKRSALDYAEKYERKKIIDYIVSFYQ